MMRIANKSVILLTTISFLIVLLVITQIYRGGPDEIGVWFYSRDFTTVQTSMVDKLIERNINTIYFSAPNDRNGWDDPIKSSQYANFIDYARSKGMKVFGVTLEDPTYVLMTESELNAAFGGFISKTKDKFDTYVIDVEPHSINVKYPGQYPEYKDNVKYYLEKYIQMSKILRKIADNYGVKYVDTIPPNYHTQMINAGIAGGINQLSSHSVNLMAYEDTIEKVLDSISMMRADSAKRLVININVAPHSSDPALGKDQIPRALKTLKQESLSIGIWSAQDVVNLDARLFQI